MFFNSYVFLFLFLPVLLIGYYTIIQRGLSQGAKIWLMGMSLWFYGYFNIGYLILLIISIFINYLMLHRMWKASQKTKKMLMILGVICNLSLLAFFKYAGFFIEYTNEVFGSSPAIIQIALPLGISFYTFSQIAFLVDTYNGEIKELSIIDYCLYVTYFPKILQGPITLHSEMLPQFKQIGYKRRDADLFYRGLALFIFGLSKKILIADTFGSAVDLGYMNLGRLNSGDAILLVLGYTIQLYFDFSGYCDMAMGVSRMLGIELPVNFDSPYKAENIIAFWKKWHITLNRFFMKYVYIPLGGNRKGRARTYCNLMIIFLLSGLWHGTGMQFIVWGFMHGLLYVITRAFQQQRERKGRQGYKHNSKILRGLKVFATFLYVNIAWIFFRAADLKQAAEVFAAIAKLEFGKLYWDFAGCFNIEEFWYIVKVLKADQWQYAYYIIMVVFFLAALFIIFCTPNAVTVVNKLKPTIPTTLVLSILFIWCVLSLSQVNSFLYVNF